MRKTHQAFHIAETIKDDYGGLSKFNTERFEADNSKFGVQANERLVKYCYIIMLNLKLIPLERVGELRRLMRSSSSK
jgi:hypothetical protein